jgi:hypothetical protein
MEVNRFDSRVAEIVLTPEERSLVNKAFMDRLLDSAVTGGWQYSHDSIFIELARTFLHPQNINVLNIKANDETVGMLMYVLECNSNINSNDAEKAEDMVALLWGVADGMAEAKQQIDREVESFVLPDNLSGF